MVIRLGLGSVTLRDYYQVNNRITQPSSEDLARQEELFDVLLDGKVLGDGLLRPRGGDPFNLAFDQEFEEGLDLARVLLVSGLHPAVITSKKPPFPDKQVVFCDGHEQYVELGRILSEESARRLGSENFLRHGIYERYASDKVLQAAIANRTIQVTLPKLPVTDDARKLVVDQIVEYFRRTTLTAVRATATPFDDPCPTLRELGATYAYLDTPSFSAIRIDTPVRVADPAEAVSAFQDMVAKKQRKTYKGASSTWLVLVIKDTEQAEADALAAVEPELRKSELGQFNRIIVGYERGSICI